LKAQLSNISPADLSLYSEKLRYRDEFTEAFKGIQLKHGVVICNFIYNLFNDAASNSEYIMSNDGILVNNELENTWKEAVAVKFNILSRHLPGWTDGDHEKSVRISGLRAEI
jgi:hypothetical protein